MDRHHSPSGDDRLMRAESTESWEVLQVPSASGQEESLVTVSQLNIPPKPKKEGSMERLLMDAQRESLQSSARQSLRQSKHGSPGYPDSPAESGDYYLSYDEFARRMLPDPDGSTDWFWDWNYQLPMSPASRSHGKHRSYPVPRKLSSVKRKFIGLWLLTNVVALLLGAGLGYYLSKKIYTGQEVEHNEMDMIARRIFRYN